MPNLVVIGMKYAKSGRDCSESVSMVRKDTVYTEINVAHLIGPEGLALT